MDESETQTLKALAWMVQQYLSDADGTLDNLAMTAGELAMQILAEHGFVALENSRIGKWTEAGSTFLHAN